VSSTGSGTASSSSTGSRGATTAQQRCEDAFPGEQLLAWGSTTVAELRSYGYSGPVTKHPLEGAFADQPGETGGTRCDVFVSGHTSRWWAVVEGTAPVRVLTITGPGEETLRGEVDGPPIVP